MPFTVDPQGAFSRLQEAVRCKTVTYKDRSKIDFSEFDKLHALLQKNYPLLFQNCEVEKVLDYALLIRWPGTEAGAPAIGVMGHQDVVPDGEPESAAWEGHRAFDADDDGAYIWGRGTLDMKGQLLAWFEALEGLMEEGFKPRRDIYLLSGHNEETGTDMPDSGAVALRRLLEERGVRFQMILDEGGAFFDGTPFGIKKPLAFIGLCEKGYMDVELRASQAGGHASMPPVHSALGNVCRAVAAVEDNPCKPAFNSAVSLMFDALIPYMEPKMGNLLKRRSLFGGAILKQLVKAPSSAAMVRSTTAPTMAAGSPAPNVLAQEAVANINCRIAPDETCEEVLSHIRGIVGNEVEVRAVMRQEPSPVSGTGAEFSIIAQAIAEDFPEIAAPAPYIMIAGSDSKEFYGLCDNVYRVGPFFSMLEDFTKIHSAGERVKKDDYLRGIMLFYHILKKAQEAL